MRKRNYKSKGNHYKLIVSEQVMTLTPLLHLDVIEEMENFLNRIRLPEKIRPKLDFGYKIEGQSVIVLEIFPDTDNPSIFFDFPVAKATYIKSKNHWKVFGLRANMKWNSYPHQPIVGNIAAFCKLVEEDEYYYFWG